MNSNHTSVHFGHDSRESIRTQHEKLNYSLEALISRRNVNKWSHDMYHRKTPRPHLRRRAVSHDWGYYVRLSNLHWDVTKSDVLEFLSKLSNCPPVAHVSILYDKSGRSEGVSRIKVRSMEHAKQLALLFSETQPNWTLSGVADGNGTVVTANIEQ